MLAESRARINSEPGFVQGLADFARIGLKEGPEAVPPAKPEPPSTSVEALLDVAVGEEPSTTKPKSPFSLVATTRLDAVVGKETVRCFTPPQYASHRDKDFAEWLLANQPDEVPCMVQSIELSKDWTFAEAAAAILGVTEDASRGLLALLLIKGGHTLTLTQVEEMVELTERGEKTGLRIDGFANFFFVETGDERNPVSVGRVGRGDREWGASVRRLSRGTRWRTVHRLLVRNLGAGL